MTSLARLAEGCTGGTAIARFVPSTAAEQLQVVSSPIR